MISDAPMAGRALLAAGLTERAVLACFGASCLAHVPRALAHRPGFGQPAPAAVLPWLFAAGATIPIAQVRARLGDRVVDALRRLELIAGETDVRATRALVPLGDASLAICDRLDAPPAPGAVLWPDDSSHHLIGALPARRVERWLDIGTGSGLAPLAARGRARHARATDLNPRAIDAAALGAALSGADLALAVADLGDGSGWDLVTFNAPIPAEAGIEPDGASIHRRAPPGAAVLERFWRQAPDLIADGGEIVVHSVLTADPLAATADLVGAVAVVRYTPPGAVAFGITVWRPGDRRHRRVIDVALRGDRPHVRRDDVDAGLA
jgi:hypothetical protein